MASLRRSTVRWSASACLVFLFVGAIGGCGSETTADVTNAVEAEALRILGNNMARNEAELLELAAIPSIAALPQHQSDVARAADWLVSRLHRAGFERAEAMDTGAQPVVYGEWLLAGDAAPTVLIYAHYDVQPADPLEMWHTPPFSPVLDEEAGLFRGRGVSDNKQGVLMAIHAVEVAIRASGGDLPVNVKLLLEGQEEVQSPNLESFMAANAHRFACDYVFNADGMQIGKDVPGVLLGMRGTTALEVELRTAHRDLHSGTHGGSIQNPNHALATLVASLHDNDGAVAVDGFYEGVQPPSEADRRDMAEFPFNEAAEAAELGVVEPFGEAGFTTLERRWLRPTLEVVGMWGGFTGEGLKTVLPAVATAKLACRLVSGQSPQDAADKVEAHLMSHLPPGANITVRRLGLGALPFSADRSSPAAKVAARVLQEVMGARPVFFKSGASIPALAILHAHLGVEPVCLGFKLDSDLLHSPNERFHRSLYRQGHEVYVKLLFAIGGDTKRHEALPRSQQHQHSEL